MAITYYIRESGAPDDYPPELFEMIDGYLLEFGGLRMMGRILAGGRSSSTKDATQGDSTTDSEEEEQSEKVDDVGKIQS